MAIQRASMLSRLRLLLYLCAKAAEFSTQEKKRDDPISVPGHDCFFFFCFFSVGAILNLLVKSCFLQFLS